MILLLSIKIIEVSFFYFCHQLLCISFFATITNPFFDLTQSQIHVIIGVLVLNSLVISLSLLLLHLFFNVLFIFSKLLILDFFILKHLFFLKLFVDDCLNSLLFTFQLLSDSSFLIVDCIIFHFLLKF